jgi:hypothetical protein
LNLLVESDMTRLRKQGRDRRVDEAEIEIEE